MNDRMTIRTHQRRLVDQLKFRLIFTILLLLGCFLLSSIIGVFAMMNQLQLGEKKVSIQNNINSLLQAMVDQETGLRGYVTTDNTSFLDPLHSGRIQYSTALQNLRTDLANANISLTFANLNQVDERASLWVNTFADPQIALMQDGNLTMARSNQVNAQGKTLFDNFRRSIAQLQQVSDSDLVTLQTQVNVINFSALGGSLLLALLAIIWLWRTFTRFTIAQREQLAILRETAAAFGAGDLTARVQDIFDADLREVGQTFNVMAVTLQQQQNALKDRDILEQVSQLNSILTNSLDLRDLMDKFLNASLPLLDVQVAAFYLYDLPGQQLRLFASRGLPATDLQTTFNLGEGLVGRAAQERRALLVSDPNPDETKPFQIKTMLGKVLPSSLYHLPLFQGNELLGLLVVGSLYPIREQTRNVFNVVVSNVASAISNTQAYARIQEQAQQLAKWANEQEQANHILRQQRDELTTLNAALEEANRARSRFLSTMSHELRTPLTSIIGFSQIMLRTSTKAPLSERQSGNVERILKNAQHLLTLINDVLDLAKVEAGRMDINATAVPLPALLHALVDETRSIASERGLQITVVVDEDVSTIETDPLKLRQIILNLLSNAIKFTEQGSVTLSAQRHSFPNDKQVSGNAEQVFISVKDTGIGIDAAQQARIFEAFYQVDNSNSRNYGGTGLGLSIVREFTTLLGGKIEIESKPDEGTTFTIILPMHAHDLQSLQDLRLNTLHPNGLPGQRFNGGSFPLPASFSGPEVSADTDELLVVAIDDNPDVLQLIAASLEQSPYRVVGVQDATRAVAVIQELKPHAVTLDIMMPKINGWQILHELKSNPATAMIPVILLTVLEDRSAGYVLGADEYLVKPVARDALITTLHQLTTNSPVNRDSSARNVTEAGYALLRGDGKQTQQLKPVLLVHTEPDVHALIDRLVKETGYQLQRTEEGQDIMALIAQAPPDLLMLFVQLEKMINGQHELPNQSFVESDDAGSLDTIPNPPENPRNP